MKIQKKSQIESENRGGSRSNKSSFLTEITKKAKLIVQIETLIIAKLVCIEKIKIV